MSLDNRVELYKVMRDDERKFIGTHNQCFEYILDHQSQSVEWAIKHEGWRIELLPDDEREVYHRIETYNGEPIYYNTFLNNFHAYPLDYRAPYIQVPITGDTIEYVREQIDIVKGVK